MIIIIAKHSVSFFLDSVFCILYFIDIINLNFQPMTHSSHAVVIYLLNERNKHRSQVICSRRFYLLFFCFEIQKK